MNVLDWVNLMRHSAIIVRRRPGALPRLLVFASALALALPATPAAAQATWTVVPTPSTSTVASALQDVTVLSTTNAWAVGYRYDSTVAAFRTLTMRFDGTRWNVVPSPNASSTGYNQLKKVDAISASDVWALGNDAQTGDLVERFNGASWSIMPHPTTGSVRGMDAVSSTDVWTVGFSGSATYVSRWNGSSWVTIPSLPPGPGRHLMVLEAVAARTPTDVWAVGWDRDYDTAGRPVSSLVAHWNGTAWTRVPSPNPLNRNILYDVVALAADDVWAVGVAQDTTSGIRQRSLLMHWNGTAWQNVPAPQAEAGSDDHLHAIAAVSPASLWAVGYYHSPTSGLDEPLLLHAVGSTVTKDPGPTIADPATLWGAAALSDGTVWEVGYATPAGSGDRTLSLRATGG
jgi:hypothetical protein